MSNTIFWALILFSIVMLVAGLVFSRRQREAGLMMAFLGLVVGLFTLGFVVGPLVFA